MSMRLRPAHSIVSLVAAVCLLSVSAVAEYRESRELTLDTSGLTDLRIDAGPGRLDVRGVDGLERIEARAEIVVERISDSSGADYVSRTVVFDLRKEAGGARLTADHRGELARRDWNTHVNLVVRMPSGLALMVDDDSGDLEIEHLASGLHLHDDSGDAIVRDIVGGMTVDDDSGELIVESVQGDVSISDDSGDVSIRHILGGVEIDDDSGDVTVEDITGDVRIYDDSGDIEVNTVHGNVTIDDDSGDISIDDVSGGLEILDAGSGDLQVDRVQGMTRIES